MIKFEDQIDGGISIISQELQIQLAPNEAFDLWQWLSVRKDALQAFSSEKQLELKIHLYQEDMSHLAELKAVIPDLQELEPEATVLDARLETVPEQVLQLLDEYQIEYHIHPLLEDDDVYAQG